MIAEYMRPKGHRHGLETRTHPEGSLIAVHRGTKFNQDRILQEIEKIKGRIERLESIEKHASGNDATREPDQYRTSKQPLSPIGTYPPKTESAHPEVQDPGSAEKKKRRKTISFHVNWIGVVVLTVYTGCTIALLVTGKEANKITKENAAKDQRPYVMAEGIYQEPSSSIKTGEFAQFRVTANSGKSPALEVISKRTLFILRGREPKSFADEFFSRLPATLTGPNIVLSPNFHTSLLNEETTKRSPDNLWIGTLIGQSYSTEFSYTALTDEDVYPMHHKPFALMVVGRIQYRDLFGTIYSTDYCVGSLPSGAMKWCDDHNVIN